MMMVILSLVVVRVLTLLGTIEQDFIVGLN
jgi:hypothetical protein